jgi:hypothetical protein
MNPGLFIPFAVIATAKKSRRSRLTEAMLPAMIPLPPTQAVAMSAIVADQQVRSEERRVERARGEEAAKTQALLKETIEVCQLLTAKAVDEKLTIEEFDEFGTIKALLAKRPDDIKKFVTVEEED